MPYKCEIEGDILIVEETLMSWRGSKTNVFFFDIVNWKRRHYRDMESIYDHPLTESQIQWIKNHYIPKVDVKI